MQDNTTTLDTVVCVRLPKAWVRTLKRLARSKAVELDQDVSIQRLVRDAIASQLLQQS